MTIDLDDLEARARAATQSKWELYGCCCMVTGSVNTYSGPVLGKIVRAESCSDTDLEGRTWTCGGSQGANAAYIVAAQPSVVLELIARVRELEAGAGEPDAYKISVGGYVSLAPTFHMAREAAEASPDAIITPLYAAPPFHAALHEQATESKERELREEVDRCNKIIGVFREQILLLQQHLEAAYAALGGSNG